MQCKIDDCALVATHEFRSKPRAACGYNGESFMFCGMHLAKGRKYVKNINRRMRTREQSIANGDDWEGRDCEGCGEYIDEANIIRADQKFCSKQCRIKSHALWREEERKNKD